MIHENDEVKRLYDELSGSTGNIVTDTLDVDKLNEELTSCVKEFFTALTSRNNESICDCTQKLSELVGEALICCVDNDNSGLENTVNYFRTKINNLIRLYNIKDYNTLAREQEAFRKLVDQLDR